MSKFKIDQTSSGHIRLECACGSAVVKQPWMIRGDWNTARKQFKKRHYSCKPIVKENAA